MKTKQIVLTEFEIAAIREAATEYYQNISKHVLARGKDDVSPYHWKMHKAVESLRYIDQPSH